MAARWRGAGCARPNAPCLTRLAANPDEDGVAFARLFRRPSIFLLPKGAPPTGFEPGTIAVKVESSRMGQCHLMLFDCAGMRINPVVTPCDHYFIAARPPGKRLAYRP